MAQEVEWEATQEMVERKTMEVVREITEIWDKNQMTAMEWATLREMVETWEHLRKKVNNYNKEGR